jgi:hypothetical protein
MQAALAANGDAPLLWWLMVDYAVPEENLALAHQVWLEAVGNA